MNSQLKSGVLIFYGLLFSFVCQAQLTIHGNISCESGEPLEGVTVMSSLDEVTATTDASGNYTLNDVSPFTTILPYNNEYTEKCFDAFDMYLMKQNIQAWQFLPTPYRVIAADVDFSNMISTFDMVILQKAILGINEFPTEFIPWRFIRADHEFPEVDPFEQNFDIPVGLPIEDESIWNANFIGVKVGDIQSGCCEETPSDEPWNLSYETEFMLNGQLLVKVKSNNFQDIIGFQFDMRIDSEEFSYVNAVWSDLPNFVPINAFELSDEIISVCWINAGNEPISLLEDEFLFQLILNVENPDNLPENIIQIEHGRIEAEAYREDGYALGFSPEVVSAVKDSKETNLFLYNQPNPFSETTEIVFDLPNAANVKLEIFDVNGKTILNQTKAYETGSHRVAVNSETCSNAGIYFYQITTDEFQVTKRMIKG